MSELVDSDFFPVRSDVEATVKATKDIFCTAQNCGVELWLCYGALLGIVRENRLLPWNNDVELGCVYNKDIFNNLKNLTDELNSSGYFAIFYSTIGAIAVQKPGFDVRVNINIFWLEDEDFVRPHETAGQSKNGVPILGQMFWWTATLLGAYGSKPRRDERCLCNKQFLKLIFIFSLRFIFPYFIRKKLIIIFYLFSRWFGAKSQKTALPRRLIQNLGYLDFYGDQVKAPIESNDLLCYLYGDDWKTPKDNWSFYADENKGCTSVKFINEQWNWNSTEML